MKTSLHQEQFIIPVVIITFPVTEGSIDRERLSLRGGLLVLRSLYQMLADSSVHKAVLFDLPRQSMGLCAEWHKPQAGGWHGSQKTNISWHTTLCEHAVFLETRCKAPWSTLAQQLPFVLILFQNNKQKTGQEWKDLHSTRTKPKAACEER